VAENNNLHKMAVSKTIALPGSQMPAIAYGTWTGWTVGTRKYFVCLQLICITI
jgi:hypothetical protein